jgi:hypothetical protein
MVILSRPPKAPDPSRDKSQNLYRVAYKVGRFAHWAFFVPDQDYSRQGTLVYLEAGKTFLGKPCYKLQTKELRISTRDTLMQAHRWIPNTRISLNKLLLVAEHVFKSGNYATAARNGKNFCVDVTHTLYTRHSVGVSSWAMQDVEQNGVDISRETLVLVGN